MNCSTVDIPFLSEGLVIAAGGEEGEKVDLKICLARELNLGLQRERREHRPLYQEGLFISQKIYHEPT